MNGIYLINKPKGISSHQVVQDLIGKFNLKKAGHAGTLDPLATGLLIVAVNDATKIIEIFQNSDKEYIATGKFGIKTDTGDIAGNTIEQENVNIKKTALINCLANFPINYQQEIPKYSAKKVKGKPLYQYARENIGTEKFYKEVAIKNIDLIDFNNSEQTFIIRVLVSKGTFIRSLIEDIAKELKTVATMTNLKRTMQSGYILENAKNITEINENDIISYQEIFKDYYKQEIDYNLIKNGQLIAKTNSEDVVLFVNDKQEPLALYKTYPKDKTKLKPWKMLKK